MECNCNECVDKGYSRELLEQAKLLWEIHKSEFKPFHKTTISLLQWIIENWDTYGQRVYEGWDWDKNSDESREMWLMSSGAEIEAWFVCKEGHSWQTKLSNITGRNRNSWCIYCSNQKVLKGYNDLETWCNKPENKEVGERIKNGWMREKNLKEFGITIDSVTKSTHKKAWFICGKGHEWITDIVYVTNNKSWCVYCCNQRVLKGYNDLETWCLKPKNSVIGKRILSGWSDKNNFGPDEVVEKTNKYIWFKCKNGHEWRTCCATVKRGSWCPKCATNKTSFPEQVVYCWCKEQFNEVHSRLKIEKKEADVFIKDINLVIEYQGEGWHRTKEDLDYDYDKYIHFKNLGYNVLWVVNNFNFEDKIMDISMILHDYKADEQCREMIKKLSDYIWTTYKIKTDANISEKMLLNAWEGSHSINDEDILINWCNNHKTLPQSKMIIECWNYEENNKIGLYIDKINYNSAKKAYFNCPKCKSLLFMRIYAITKDNCGCVYCNGSAIIVGLNDFKTIAEKEGRVDLLNEWDYSANDILPTELKFGSAKWIYWKCEKGHTWKARLCDRKAGYCNCSKCRKNKGVKIDVQKEEKAG